MRQVSSFFIFVGVFLVLLGFLLRAGLKLKWLGRLPGDLMIQKGDFTLYFPLATSLLLSLFLSLVLCLGFRLFSRN